MCFLAFETALIILKIWQVEKAKQDDALSDLSNLLGELKDMALDMGSEIGRLVFKIVKFSFRTMSFLALSCLPLFLVMYFHDHCTSVYFSNHFWTFLHMLLDIAGRTKPWIIFKMTWMSSISELKVPTSVAAAYLESNQHLSFGPTGLARDINMLFFLITLLFQLL